MMNEKEIFSRIECLEEIKAIFSDEPDILSKVDVRINTLKAVLSGNDKKASLCPIVEVP